jgi:hypothetical protein
MGHIQMLVPDNPSKDLLPHTGLVTEDCYCILSNPSLREHFSIDTNFGPG